MSMTNFTIPDDAWERDRHSPDMSAVIYINTVRMMARAIEVNMNDGTQEATSAEGQVDLDDLGTLTAADGPFQTAKIHGREYVVYLAPLAR